LSMQALLKADREALKESFAEHGYFIVRNVVSRDKLSALRASIVDEFEHAKRSGQLFAGGGQMSGHLNCFPGEQSRFAYDALLEHGIVDLMREISPRTPMTPDVGCNLNLPRSVTQHYHVDSPFTEHFMLANVAVVDTDLANGAIDVLPGTHKKFYKYWRFTVERLNRLTTRLALNQGDVLVRTSNLWHRGMPNLTTSPRPMLALTFVKGRDEREPRDPFQQNGGKTTFYPNWFRPDFLGRMRERTFIAAPFTYSAYRFVRSLVGNKGYGTPA
jgi:ectoine hydroxylase-related dioxygenase (phytanoyl-CoA dioxygenase family)